MKERIDGYLVSLLHRIDAVAKLEATFHRMGTAPAPALCNSPRPISAVVCERRASQKSQQSQSQLLSLELGSQEHRELPPAKH